MKIVNTLQKSLVDKLNLYGTHYIYQIDDSNYSIVSREKKLELMLYNGIGYDKFKRLSLSSLDLVKGNYKEII